MKANRSRDIATRAGSPTCIVGDPERGPYVTDEEHQPDRPAANWPKDQTPAPH